MNWKKRVTGLLLTGVLAVSMVPASMAADTGHAEPEASSDVLEQKDTGVIEENDIDHEEPVIQEGVKFRTDHAAYMEGYGDGSFGPNENLTWAQVCSVIYSQLQDQTMGTQPYTYTDVHSGSWYYRAVCTLASQGILQCDGGKLHPNNLITRGEFIALAVRLVGIDENAECSFTDVDRDNPYYSAIATAVAKGWINGFADNTFRPNESLTRVQAVSVCNSLLGRKIDETVLETAPETLRSYTDVSTDAWYYKQVMEASIDHDGETNADGTETWRSYTHAYTVTFQYSGIRESQNVYEGHKPYQVPTKDNDGKTITHWIAADGSIATPENTAVYEPAVYTAWYAPSLVKDHIQYVYGYGDGRFGPNDALTRAQACMLVYSLLADQTAGTEACSFTDVTPDAWYYQPITILASKGLITAGGKYRPKDVMRRGEFIEMVTRLTAYTSGNVAFPDVTKDNPYYNAIATAVAKGWIYGFDDGNFYPYQSLTRAQAVTVLNKVAGRMGDPKTAQQLDSRYMFTDVKKSFWGYQAIMEAATTHTYKISYGVEVWLDYT